VGAPDAHVDPPGTPLAPGSVAAGSGVRDLWPRLLLSPVVGAIVANVSGLIDNSRHGPAALVLSYLSFTAIALIIWEGNRRIYFRLQQREDWLQRPLRRIGLLLGAILLYTVPVATILMSAWRLLSGDPGAGPHAVPMAVLAAVTGVVAITHAYETVFLLRDWESDRLRRARTEHARLEAELEALSRQIDPHFLFNHLNALAGLIEARSAAAVPFLTALGDTYRYVLDARGRHLVPLAEELQSLARHEALARIRQGGGIVLEVDVPDETARGVALPPVSLGELFQNAVKHNHVDEMAPLRMRVTIDRDTLLFENELRVRRHAAVSTGVGLVNVSRRFVLATGRPLVWGREGSRFVVRLPLVPLSDDATPLLHTGPDDLPSPGMPDG
jgi:hypothetical protein